MTKKKVIHLLTLLPLLIVLAAFECLAEFTDTDWNMEFNDHCGFPKTEGDYHSVKWAKDGQNKYLRFELRRNDEGLCSYRIKNTYLPADRNSSKIINAKIRDMFNE